MKVIQQGTPFKSFRQTCNTCGAILEVGEADIRCNYWGGDQRNESETSYIATCPCCEYPFNVEENKMTEYCKKKLLRKARGY
jgi:hypothetical protein